MPAEFSTFALFVAGLASVNAYTEPTTGPSGNPIAQPTLNEIVPVGQPYSITWQPTCDGTVTILLLRGPSENVDPLFPIVEETPNDGEYAWTPGTDLKPDTARYGLQLICDATGEFQYSTQFGISNDGSAPGEPSPTEPKDSDDNDDDVNVPNGYYDTDKNDIEDNMYPAQPYALSSHDIYSYEVVDTLTTYVPEPTDVVVNNITYHCPEPTTLTITDCPCTVTHTPEGPFPVHPPYPITPSSGMPASSDIIQPTGSMSVPSTLIEDSTTVAATNTPVQPTDTPDATDSDDAAATQTTAGASGLAVGGSAGLGLVVALAVLVGLF